MNIYFSGIGGVGLGPLAEIARDAGHGVFGSDATESLTTDELLRQNIPFSTDQSGDFLTRCHEQKKIDWFVYTTALADDHPELIMARKLGIPISKRDELLTQIIKEKNLKLIAVAGTHGKTSTTALMVWVLKQLGVPISYSAGSTISFGPSGFFDPASSYFVYECDEYDRNFLHFRPFLTLLTSVDFDHPDTYPTQRDYVDAFSTFLAQSNQAIMWRRDTVINIVPTKRSWILDDREIIPFQVAGEHNRANATLVAKACEFLGLGDAEQVKSAIESFPGASRRFEKLADNLYSDYGHHPVEVAATLQLARELNDHVVLVYQPHQNTRQHQVRSGYTTCMQLAETIFWLPTYQSRENMLLPILTPEQLTGRLVNRGAVHYASLDETLWGHIQQARQLNKLVLCMGAGTIDHWVREMLASSP
ncbi:MAG: Mur ligase domain-containing protein [Candidatus Saccharimonas aalborgensis]